MAAPLPADAVGAPGATSAEAAAATENGQAADVANMTPGTREHCLASMRLVELQGLLGMEVDDFGGVAHVATRVAAVRELWRLVGEWRSYHGATHAGPLARLNGGLLAQRVADIALKSGVTGYTLLPTLAGTGRSGAWRRDDVTGAQNKVVFVTVTSEAQAQALTDALTPLLDSHRLVLFVSDVQVVRASRF